MFSAMQREERDGEEGGESSLEFERVELLD